MGRKQPPKTVVLNPEQQFAVDAGPGVWAVPAGPGSGKTQVIVERYRRLVAEGVDPSQVLTLTFTAEAAKNMSTRAGVGKVEGGHRPAGFCTFHSLALSFCILEHEHFPYPLAPFPLATEGQSAKFVGEVSRRYNLDFKTLRASISTCKRNRVRPAEALKTAEAEGHNQAFALAYREYEEKCKAAGVVDFDGLILEMQNILFTKPDVRLRWIYDYIQVDESGDCDELQWDIVRLMSDNIFAVGDVGQTIYEWRGAHPDLFLNFEKLFPESQKLYLATNYRATKKLVEFLREIGPVKDLAERFRTDNEEGEAPQFQSYPTTLIEAQSVAEQAAALSDEKTVNVAILSRTNRGLRPYEEALSRAGKRYHLLGRSGFFQQREIRDVLAFVQLIQAPFDSAVLAAIRSPYACSRYIKKKELVDALKAMQKGDPNKPTIWSLLKDYRPADHNQARAIPQLISFIHSLLKYRDQPANAAVSGVIKDLQAMEYYQTEEEAVDNDPAENLQELVRIAGRFSSIQELLEHARKMQGAAKVKRGVALSTVHQAKGKEWDNVFVTDVTEGNIPHKNGDAAEEERIWFVACSRAAKRLTITYTTSPSRYIEKFVQKTDEIVEDMV